MTLDDGLNPTIDITDFFRDHKYAVAYVAALEAAQRDSDKRYEKRIAELEAELLRVASCIFYKWPSEAKKIRNLVEKKTD